MNNRGELRDKSRHREGEEVRRALQERERGLQGRETFDLDFCWASQGKTGALVLQ